MKKSVIVLGLIAWVASLGGCATPDVGSPKLQVQISTTCENLAAQVPLPAPKPNAVVTAAEQRGAAVRANKNLGSTYACQKKQRERFAGGNDMAGEYSHAEMMDMAEKAAETAIKRMLLTIGIDVTDPLKTQKDFAIMREIGSLAMDAEFRKDIEHTRMWRKTIESITSKGLMTGIAVIVTGALGALWMAFKLYLASIVVTGGH